MKTLTKIALVVALILTAGTVAMAQSYKEDPRYGNTPEEREKNAKAYSFLRDEYTMKNWDYARGYIKSLMNDAPKISINLYIYGVGTYKRLVERATSVAEKKVYVDSIMLIFDRRVENFGNEGAQGTTVLQMKAQEYSRLNPMDREGIIKLYKDALEAVGAEATSGLVLEYFQQLINGYKEVKVTTEELIGAYQQLSPLMENAPQNEKDDFTGLFARSGAADCGVLEDLYSKELASKPGDIEILKKAYGLMSMANCDSEFYISVAEQLYAVEPTSSLAIRLALAFEKSEQYDKALKYLSEMIETETDPAEKSNLYSRVAASELSKKSYSAAAQAARQAIALNSANGTAHFCLGQAYIGGAVNCKDFDRQTVYWLAYDELVKAREALAGDTSELLKNVNASIAGCRANFPSNEDLFLHSLQPNTSFNVSCGWISGTTTVRGR